MKYQAFISYRHGGIDEMVATKLQREIEKYKLPSKIAKAVGKKHIGRVFRDADELRAASDLSQIIKDAVDESEWLFVICSLRYKDSVWCMEEVEHFIKVRDREHIIVILVEGEPDESFPKILTEVERDGEMVSIEPLAVDVRGNSDKEILKNLKKERFRFFASMLTVDYDDLRQRQRERARRRAIAFVSTAFIALSAVLGVITYKNIQLKAAYQAVQKGESFYLSEYADAAYQNADQKTAMMLALAALPSDINNPDRPFVPGVLRSLTTALGVYDFSYGYQGKQLYDIGQDTTDVKTQISADRKLLLVEKQYYAANNTLHREVDVYEIATQQKCCSFPLQSIDRSYANSLTRAAYLLNDSKTLIYLSEDGLKAVDVYTNEEQFSGEVATECKLNDDGNLIAVMNYETGFLYTYDLTGEMILDCELGTDLNYTLGEISTSGKKLSVAVNTEDSYGIIVLDSATGENEFIEMVGLCTNVRFIDDNRLCFLLSDDEAGLKHVVQYDIAEGKQGYLCNADWNLTTMTVTEDQTCYYYHDNAVYEIDCNSEKGDQIWEHTFATDVLSITAGEGIVAFSCKDGSVNFYDEKTKELINVQKGNGEGYYLLSVDEQFSVLRDYWGKNVRVYEKTEEVDSTLQSADLKDAMEWTPDKWYTCDTNGDQVVLGLGNGINQKLVVVDTKDLNVVAKSDLSQMQIASFDNVSIDVKNGNYLSIQNFDYNQTKHWDMSLKPTLEFDENSYYYYDETGETIYLSDDKVQVMDAATGKIKETFEIPDGYDRGVQVGDYKVYSSSYEILIEQDGKEVKTIEDAELYAFHNQRGLIFYRDSLGEKWYVYSLEKGKVVLKGDAGMYSCTMFFGEDENQRYFLNDYKGVYDLDTMKQVLDLSEISNGVYGVKTTKDLPYFVVWYQEGDTRNSGKASGSNIGYIYAKDGTNDILAEIPNYVGLASDGQVIVFDGKSKLYKTVLYGIDQIKEMAQQRVGDSQFTEEQKEKYHLYDQK